MTELFGFLAAVVIGLTLGLIGGGGSILTVPSLVYLLGVAPVPATAYSLFIVGLTSLVGAVAYMRKGLVSFRTAAVFGIPAFIAVFTARTVIVPALPEQLFSLGGFVVSRDLALMLLFALLMLAASVSMIRKRKGAEEDSEIEFNYPMIFVEGIVVGTLTGLVGAGGGFLIIPALVILARLPMKLTVGTSLLIIATNSLLGFTGDMMTMSIDWGFLGTFSVFAIGGIVAGSWLARYISGARLRPAFGWFTLAMGVYIIGRELVFNTL
ncbi:sulfite exporter TauE/SafE family protein [bacterium]|nr:sulfite exporter TauE/SafE family protein [bacterium]